MSKGNMLLGQARGKVGSLVFSRADGKQIVRSRAEVIKNPRTQAQMIQRIMLNTIAQAYSSMKDIVDHSFQGLSEGQQSMSYFMQRNLNNLRTKVANQVASGKSLSEIFDFSPLKSNRLAHNVYEIAKGTLPQVKVSFDSETQHGVMFRMLANTYEGVAGEYGLKRGDQLTLVQLANDPTLGVKFLYARVILDPRNADGTEAPMSSPFITSGAINLPSPRNEGTFATLTAGTTTITFDMANGFTYGGAVIVSRKANDGTWMRSNATIEIDSAELATGTSLQQALDLLVQSGIEGLSDLYLNNAGTGNLPSTTTTSETSGSDTSTSGGGSTDPNPQGGPSGEE